MRLGYSRLEDYALNLAGVLALGIALFPMIFLCVHRVCLHLACDRQLASH